ncbi:MAG: CoA-binding protein [Candidatus Omnitrophota bacterium]
MQELVKEFLNQRRFAVIGSFRNESKYAYRILLALMNRGYEVFPVNPHLKEVEGMTCYARIKDIPGSVDVADIVTPPEITEKIVKECLQQGITMVWLQPGAESKQAIELCQKNDIKVIYGLCIMMESI